MATFTMAEFIKEHNLGIDVKDSGATRLIVKELKKRGFRKIRARRDGKPVWLWTNERGGRLSALETKMRRMKI